MRKSSRSRLDRKPSRSESSLTRAHGPGFATSRICAASMDRAASVYASVGQQNRTDDSIWHSATNISLKWRQLLKDEIPRLEPPKNGKASRSSRRLRPEIPNQPRGSFHHRSRCSGPSCPAVVECNM